MKPRILAVLAAVLPGGLALAPISAHAGGTVTATIPSSGTNLSFGAAENIDAAIDSDTVQQNASSFAAGGQPVSPLYYPYGPGSATVNLNLTVLGSLAASSANYFVFNGAPGALITLYATATSPPNEATQLLLFDNGSVIAEAEGDAPDGLSSVLTFPGGAGTWVAEVAQGLGTPSAINYKLQFTIGTIVSGFTTNVVGSGQLINGSLGSYAVDANAGDQLSLALRATTPSTVTDLELFDNNGNLVAIASGNGPDGFSSIINFTVPSGDSGDWTVEVVPFDFGGGAYAYDLAIAGATGFGPVLPVNPTAVPETSTWTTMLLGFAGLGLLGGRASRRGGRGHEAPGQAGLDSQRRSASSLA